MNEDISGTESFFPKKIPDTELKKMVDEYPIDDLLQFAHEAFPEYNITKEDIEEEIKELRLRLEGS